MLLFGFSRAIFQIGTAEPVSVFLGLNINQDLVAGSWWISIGLVYSWSDSALLIYLVESDEDLPIYAYADASHSDCPNTRRSTSGYVILIGKTAVAWMSKRQETVVLSTAEAEFVSACKCAQEICSIRMMMELLDFPQESNYYLWG